MRIADVWYANKADRDANRNLHMTFSEPVKVGEELELRDSANHLKMRVRVRTVKEGTTGSYSWPGSIEFDVLEEGTLAGTEGAP